MPQAHIMHPSTHIKHTQTHTQLHPSNLYCTLSVSLMTSIILETTIGPTWQLVGLLTGKILHSQINKQVAHKLYKDPTSLFTVSMRKRKKNSFLQKKRKITMRVNCGKSDRVNLSSL